MLKTLGQPDFDNGLARHAESIGFLIQGINHPNGKIDVDSFLFLQGSAGFCYIQRMRDVFACIEV